MISITLHDPNDLSDADLARWCYLRSLDAQMDGPFFHPRFSQIVSKVRTGVRVAVLRTNGQAAGFFPFHRNSRGTGHPVAGLLSDFEGVIKEPGLQVDPQALLEACGLSSWRFNHLLTNQKVFNASHYSLHESPYIELTTDFTDYKENRAASGSQVVKRTLRKLRKLTREAGPLRLELNTSDKSVLAKLIRWKSRQYRKTGLVDLFEFPWVRDLINEVLSRRDHEFGGVLTALYAGDHLVAAMMGIRTRTVLHPWFPCYSPEYASFSPGSVQLIELIRQAPESGIRRIDLGRGEERYKRSFQTGSNVVAQGSVERNFMTHFVRKSCHLAYHWLKRSTLRKPLQIPGRMIKNASERAALK